MAEQKKIGRYVIEGILGEGAMGSVFKAHDPNLERTVAIKTMRTANIQKKEDYAEFKERFFLESRANGRLNHPNIVSVYDSGLMDKDPFLVMEYIKGKSLDVFMEDQGDSYLDSYMVLMKQIASGLDYAHEEGVVHRDIKPGNILISFSRSGRLCAKLVDFGLAKLKDSKLTQTGYFLGTPSYASPEQVLSGKLDASSDIFSFGTVAYETLTGILPFDAESLHSILYRIANEKPNLDFSRFADHVDTDKLHAIFTRIFQKDPKARFETAGDFIEQLEKLLAPLKKVKISVKVTSEAHSVPALEETSISEKDELTNSLQKQIREMRQLFENAVESKNLSSSKYCYQELKKLGADLANEKMSLESLRQELRKQEKEKRKNERVLRVKKARSQFKLALKTRNVLSVEFCLKELERLKVDTSREKQYLERLKQKLEQEKLAKDAEEQLRRSKYIEGRRDQLAQALEQKDVQRCGILLKELGSLLKVDVSSERESLQRIKDELAREREVEATRAAFLDSLAEKDLKKCRGVLARLKELGADTSKEKEGLNELIQEHNNKDEEQFKERVITRTREAFRDAVQRGQIGNCLYYLRELKQMQVDTTEEDRIMSGLEEERKKAEAESLRQSMIAKTREEFRRAYDDRNLESCKYYTRELEQLESDFTDEQMLTDELEKTLRAEAELANNMIKQVRDRFKTAIEKDDLKDASGLIKLLKGLGASISTEETLLKNARNKPDSSPEKEKLKAKMVSQFRNKFQEGYNKGNRDTCRYYIKELMLLGADVKQEHELLSTLA